MKLELVSRPEFEEWTSKLEAQIQRVIQLGQGNELIVYDNDDLSMKMKVSKRTLQNWRDGGLIEFSQVGHKIYYTGNALSKFLENRKVRFYGK